MDESILNSVKKAIGVSEEYDAFDTILIMHINSVFMILNQLGIGPSEGFSIMDDATMWSDYISEDDTRFEAVKSYMSLKVRLLFDPPLSSTVMECMKQSASEMEWRLNVQAELSE